MSDTPKRFNWSSAGMLPATSGAFVHESALAAATKERDEAGRILLEAFGSTCLAPERRKIMAMDEAMRKAESFIEDHPHIFSSGAQLYALQSATPQDHARVIEEAAKVFSETIGSLEVLGTFYRHSPTWETCKIEDVLTEARKAYAALVSTILTPQPRKEAQ